MKILHIGYSGKYGAGKDELASAINSYLLERGCYSIKRSFGDALKEEVAGFVRSFTYEDARAFVCTINDRLEQKGFYSTFTPAQLIDPLITETNFFQLSYEEILSACHNPEQKNKYFRSLLQWWGTEHRRLLHGEFYWVNQVEQWRSNFLTKTNLSTSRYKCLVFSTNDVRFINEVEFIPKHPSDILPKDYKGVTIRIHRPGHENTGTHASEVSLDNYEKFDILIENDSTLAVLKEKAKLIAEQLCRMHSISLP